MSQQTKKNPWSEIFGGDMPSDFKNIYMPLRELIPNGEGPALDVAAGAGRHIPLLLEKGYTVSAFDVSPNLIELIKSKHSECEVVLADMFEPYPFPDNTFKLVIAIQAIYHGYREQVEEAVAQIARVINAEGTAIVTFSRNKERAVDPHRSSKQSASDLIDSEEIQEVGLNTYMPLTGREAGLVHYYPPEDVIREMFSKHFVDVKIITDDINLYYIAVATHKKK